MSSRVPPSRLPSRPAAPAAAPARPKAPKAKAAPEKTAKPKLGGPGQGEEAGESTQSHGTALEGQGGEGHERDAGKAAEHAEAWVPVGHEEQQETKALHEEVAQANEAEAAEKTDARGKALPPGTKPPALGQKQAPAKKDGFEQQKLANPQLSKGQLQGGQLNKNQSLQASQKVSAMTAQSLARADKPPDALTVLNAAKEPGVFFKEDDGDGGSREDREDPELAEAVEEAIRRLFGVRGIMRIGGGRNEANEPVVVVVVTHGFGETSLKAIPPKVRRFDTLLAVPYELLPLRKDRA